MGENDPQFSNENSAVVIIIDYRNYSEPQSFLETNNVKRVFGQIAKKPVFGLASEHENHEFLELFCTFKSLLKMDLEAVFCNIHAVGNDC